MRLKLPLLATALAFGLGMPAALAEDAPAANDLTVAESRSGTNVPGTPAEGKADEENPGALSAPEKDDSDDMPSAESE